MAKFLPRVNECPGCGGQSCLTAEGAPGFLRCQGCSRVFEPAGVPLAAIPVHPGPSLREPATVAAMVGALIEAGAIAPNGDGLLALEGVPIGETPAEAIAAVQADANLADTAAALVEASAPQAKQDGQGSTQAPGEVEAQPEPAEPSHKPAGHARHGGHQRASKQL